MKILREIRCFFKRLWINGTHLPLITVHKDQFEPGKWYTIVTSMMINEDKTGYYIDKMRIEKENNNENPSNRKHKRDRKGDS